MQPTKPRHGIYRRFIGGKLRPQTSKPKISSIYKDNVTSLSGPIMGGNVMGRLTKALKNFGVRPSHIRGGTLKQL